MIQIVGLIVAVYAIARMIQVPIEHSSAAAKVGWLTAISIASVLAIGVLTVLLMLSGINTPALR